MKDATPDVNQSIAARVRELRAAQGLSLDALAHQSGVSRSMISVIERGESNPTAVILEKLAAGLNVTFASLFDSAAAGKPVNDPVARYAEQSRWQDPTSGYIRRNVSPPDVRQPMQIVEVHFPAKARVAFENAAREIRVYQQIWVLSGAIDISVGIQSYRLREGDCVAMQLDQPTMFYNPSRKAARYAVVTASEPVSRR